MGNTGLPDGDFRRAVAESKTCATPLPSNTECPNVPIYVLESSGPGGGKFLRPVCACHLAEAINHDMRHRDGVTVKMLGWLR